MKNKQEIIEAFDELVKEIGYKSMKGELRKDDDVKDLYHGWLSQTLDTFEQEVREDERGRMKKIVNEEHYELEEWFADTQKPSEIATFKANQRSIKTRNNITRRLNQPDK